MSEQPFTAEDLQTIRDAGLTEGDVLSQLETLSGETIPLPLARACSIGDGIVAIPGAEREGLIALHDRAASQGRMTKFVPASGAASRMFQQWFEWEETEAFNETEDARVLQKQIPRFAFYDDLARLVARDGRNISDLLSDNTRKVLEYLLTPKGLDYGHLPKALIKFHAYPDGSRAALEEHLVEAVMYVQDERHVCRVHVTMSEEHRTAVEEYIAHVRDRYETSYGVRIDLSLSIQSPSTHTVAIGETGRLFRDETGRMVLRPGGHGALLKNLNEIEGDVIFVKNIDNVVPDRLKPETVSHKKILGGYLLKLQEEIFRYLRFLDGTTHDTGSFPEIADFCRQRLSRSAPPEFDTLPGSRKKKILFDILNRPLRVCGMVKNEGEPGGGPFWVEEGDGTRSLQIVEKAQVDLESRRQRAIWESSTYFNPVDLVCGIKDYRGEKFDLERYVDQKTKIISHKSHEGKPIKVLELPGLWNGSMAGWNTVFVAVPSATFNPVKTVGDLLRDEHRGAGA